MLATRNLWVVFFNKCWPLLRNSRSSKSQLIQECWTTGCYESGKIIFLKSVLSFENVWYLTSTEKKDVLRRNRDTYLQRTKCFHMVFLLRLKLPVLSLYLSPYCSWSRINQSDISLKLVMFKVNHSLCRNNWNLSWRPDKKPPTPPIKNQIRLYCYILSVIMRVLRPLFNYDLCLCLL